MKNIIKIVLLCLLYFCIGGNSLFSQIHWDSLGRKINASSGLAPNAMYADSNYLYVSGQFNELYGNHIQGIVRWNGVKWDSMGAGIDGLQYLTSNFYPDLTLAITSYHNKLYVGGLFSSLGNVNAICIGTWDGVKWDSMPIRPINSNYANGVIALAVINNKLYIGGRFDTIAGFPCVGVTCWDGTKWNSLNFPYPKDFFGVTAICEYNGSIYVGGGFAQDSLNFIARYDGKDWHSVGGGLKGDAEIYAMAVYQGDLYVAGYFSSAKGNVGNYIQKWDGTSWSDVGGGTDYEIFNLTVYNNKLYAMGELSMAGGIPASSIAEWDGSKWCSLGSNFDNNILTACTYKDSLYIGGGFWTIDGDSINYMAEWTGGNYVADCGQPTGVSEVKVESEKIKVYPNPNSGKFTFDFSKPISGTLEIYDITGQKIYQQTLQFENTEINLGNQADGMYFYRAITSSGELIGEGKVVVQK